MALAEPASARPRSSLRLRVFSALVLAPVAIAATWFGSPYLPIVVALAGVVMGWEWARLCNGGRLAASGVLLVIGIFVAAVAAASLGIATAVALSVMATATVFVARGSEGRGSDRLWLALGTLWIALPCVLLMWLAQTDSLGRPTLLWIFAIVWATDIGAYAVGRQVGGPRLAPRWSPGKTWAGLLGGIACAALAGWGTAVILGVSRPAPLVLISAGLAIVEQFGDLAESVAKRRFGVKDSSGLIPGHGGLLDRLDGLLVVVPAVALLSLVSGGSVLQWQ